MRTFIVILLAILFVTACQPASSPTPTIIPSKSIATAQLIVTSTPKSVTKIKTSITEGDRILYLDSGTVKVGIDKFWGGAISEIWYQEENMVNNFDGGRLIGVSFYDSNMPPASSNPNDTGWNPTPSDMYSHTNQPLEYSFSDNTLYLKTRYIQWYPNDKGGGQGKSIPTDIIVETWIEFLNQPETIHLKYKVTNEGNESHGIANQEFPFAYVRTPFNRFVSYTGNAPWTNDNIQEKEIALNQSTSGKVVASENWSGLVNADDIGLVLWAPQTYRSFSYSYFNNPGEPENPTFYLLPNTLLDLNAGASYETNVFLFASKWQDARAHIYTLRNAMSFPDIMPCFGTVDSPVRNAFLSGTVDIAGWAIDNTHVAKIEIIVDGNTIGKAEYGEARLDVAKDYPGIDGAPNFGFVYHLDTTSVTNGSHTVEVMATDTTGNTSLLIPGKITIDVNN
jgi:hypothetical protein